MTILEKIRRSTETQEVVGAKRRFRLHISMPILVLALIILAVTLGWSFFMGFLVGRGEDPGTRLNSLPIFGGSSPPPAAKPSVAVNDKPTAKQEIEEPKEQEEKQEEKQEDKKHKPVHPFTRPQGESMDAWGKKTQPQPAQEQVKPQSKPQESDPNEPRLDIRYQVASFPKESDAQDLTKRCQARGLSAKYQRQGKYFRVVVSFKGTRQEAQAMKTKVRGLGIKDWLVISSHYVEQPKQSKQSKNDKSDKR